MSEGGMKGLCQVNTDLSEFSQVNAGGSKMSAILSELNTPPAQSSVRSVLKINNVKKRALLVRKGFSKYIPHLRLRERRRKRVSAELSRLICTTCKTNLSNVKILNLRVPESTCNGTDQAKTVG